jgi:aspartate carbamoyltransferase catalytic subunit
MKPVLMHSNNTGYNAATQTTAIMWFMPSGRTCGSFGFGLQRLTSQGLKIKKMEATIKLIDKGEGNYTSELKFAGNMPVAALISILKKTAKGLEHKAALLLAQKHEFGTLEMDAAIDALTIDDLGE